MDKRKIIRYLAYTLEIWVLFILQETPGLMFRLWGERPSLLFLSVIAIAQFENEITLPLYSTLTEEDVRYVCKTLKECLQD